MKKVVITILCLLLLPAIVSATADAFQTSGNLTINIADLGVDVTILDGATADELVINSGNIQLTLSGNSSVVIQSSDRRILTNTLNIGTSCESDRSTLTLPAQTTETIVTITPSLTNICGQGGSGVAQTSVSVTTAAPTTGTTPVSTTAATPAPTTETTTETTAITTTETAYRENDLIRATGDEKVYVIQNGKKKHIASVAVFEAAGYQWSNVKVVSPAVVASYETYGEGTLYRTTGASEVYVVIGSMKRHIPSVEAFNAYGFNWSDIAILPVGGLEVYETANLYREEGGTKVYKIANGKKTWIKTAEEFTAAGYNWNKIVEVKAAELNFYPDTGSAQAASSTSGTILIKASTLRVRSLPSLNGSVLGSVKKGETYPILEEKGGWYKITTQKNITGWCYGGDTGGYAAKQ